jgi:hypothetical protein
MRKFIPAILLTLSSICTFAHRDNKVTIGIIDSIQSKILNEQRKIWVYAPNIGRVDPKQRFPVLYLLDVYAHFIQ